jgi:hypothetical protein
MTQQIFPLNQQIPNQNINNWNYKVHIQEDSSKGSIFFFSLLEVYLCSQEGLFSDHLQEIQKGSPNTETTLRTQQLSTHNLRFNQRFELHKATNHHILLLTDITANTQSSIYSLIKLLITKFYFF